MSATFSKFFKSCRWDKNIVAEHKGVYIIRNPQDTKREIYITRYANAFSPFEPGIAFHDTASAIKAIDELPALGCGYSRWIGERVTKFARRPTVEPKPFKSGSKVNTVAGIIDHPQLPGQKAFTFVEDDSYVACRICELFSCTIDSNPV